MWQFDNRTVPDLKTALPGPKAEALLERDHRFTRPHAPRSSRRIIRLPRGVSDPRL